MAAGGIIQAISTMKKKQKNLLYYYCLAAVLLALAGYQGYQRSARDSFYKSAYNE